MTLYLEYLVVYMVRNHWIVSKMPQWKTVLEGGCTVNTLEALSEILDRQMVFVHHMFMA